MEPGTGPWGGYKAPRTPQHAEAPFCSGSSSRHRPGHGFCRDRGDQGSLITAAGEGCERVCKAGIGVWGASSCRLGTFILKMTLDWLQSSLGRTHLFTCFLLLDLSCVTLCGISLLGEGILLPLRSVWMSPVALGSASKLSFCLFKILPHHHLNPSSPESYWSKRDVRRSSPRTRTGCRAEPTLCLLEGFLPPD